MSWLWGNETTEQAQFVVSALQSELDERESKIKALETALKREQQDMTSVLEDEVKELEARRKSIEKELHTIEALLQAKEEKLLQCRTTDAGTKKKNVASMKKTSGNSPRGAVATTSIAGNGMPNETMGSPRMKQQQQKQEKQKKKKKKKKQDVVETSVTADADGKDLKTVLCMDKNLEMVAKEEPNVAFIIQRSNNSNTVVYAGCKSADGKVLDPTNPVKVYWIMYEKEGNPREDLNMIERNAAYGVTFKPSDVQGEYMVTIASLRDRDCILRLDKHGNVMALTTIDGKKGMLLRRVFVQLTTSWGISTVDYVDIFGVDPTTFEPVYEKKKNK